VSFENTDSFKKTNNVNEILECAMVYMIAQRCSRTLYTW